MLILEYISTHGTPEWRAARMSAKESKGRLPAYEQPCTSCTDMMVLVLRMARSSDSLQLAEHSGDAAGVARDDAPSLIFACSNVCGVPYGGGYTYPSPKYVTTAVSLIPTVGLPRKPGPINNHA